MDKSNSNEFDTMGGMFSTSNDNEPENSKNNEPTETFMEDNSLTSKNIEVNELQNVTETKNNVLDELDSYTETLSAQDINLIIMGKPTSSTDTTKILEKNIDISDFGDQEEMWLEGDTRELLKVSTDEDFEVIVKSLEEAIVETEDDDIDTVTSAIIAQNKKIIEMDDDKTDGPLENMLTLTLNENDKLLKNFEPSEVSSFVNEKLLSPDEECKLSSQEIQILEIMDEKFEDASLKNENLTEINYEENPINNDCEDLLLKSEELVEDVSEEFKNATLDEEEITDNVKQEMISEEQEDSTPEQKKLEEPTSEEIKDLSLENDELTENINSGNINKKTDDLLEDIEELNKNIKLKKEIDNEVKEELIVKNKTEINLEELSDNIELETTTKIYGEPTPEKEKTLKSFDEEVGKFSENIELNKTPDKEINVKSFDERVEKLPENIELDKTQEKEKNVESLGEKIEKLPENIELNETPDIEKNVKSLDEKIEKLPENIELDKTPEKEKNVKSLNEKIEKLSENIKLNETPDLEKNVKSLNEKIEKLPENIELDKTSEKEKNVKSLGEKIEKLPENIELNETPDIEKNEKSLDEKVEKLPENIELNKTPEKEKNVKSLGEKVEKLPENIELNKTPEKEKNVKSLGEKVEKLPENIELEKISKDYDELLANKEKGRENIEDLSDSSQSEEKLILQTTKEQHAVELQKTENLFQVDKKSEEIVDKKLEELSENDPKELKEITFDKKAVKQSEEEIKATSFLQNETDLSLKVTKELENLPLIETVFSLEENNPTSEKTIVSKFELKDNLSKNMEVEIIDKNEETEEVKDEFRVAQKIEKDAPLIENRAEKHLLSVDEQKEYSPPKKIKLVREKLPLISQPQQIEKNVEISFEEEKKIEEKLEKSAIEIKQDIVKIGKEKSSTIDNKNLNESNECKSPVKIQKLKLKRSYKQEDTKTKIIENVKIKLEDSGIKELKHENSTVSISENKTFSDAPKLETENEILRTGEYNTKENIEFLSIQHENSTVCVQENKTDFSDTTKLENTIIIEEKELESENEFLRTDEYKINENIELLNVQHENSTVSLPEDKTDFPYNAKLKNTIHDEEKEIEPEKEILRTCEYKTNENLEFSQIQNVSIQENKTDFSDTTKLENIIINEEKEIELEKELLRTGEYKTYENLEFLSIEHESSTVSIQGNQIDFPDTTKLKNTISEEKEIKSENEYLQTDEYKINETIGCLNIQHGDSTVTIQENKTDFLDAAKFKNTTIHEEKETVAENEFLLAGQHKTNENLELFNIQEEPQIVEDTQIIEEQIDILKKLEAENLKKVSTDENVKESNSPIINEIENLSNTSIPEKLEENTEAGKQSKDSLLLIEAQFPLLSSRLQEPKLKKTHSSDLNLSPVPLPKISQDTVSKKLQEQLVENVPTQKREISTPDHSANMESAIKIKITKRKIDLGESTSSLVTRPLSVVVDDFENTEPESIPKLVIKSLPKEERSSPKITIKPIKPPEETYKKLKTPEEASHSPKITIKPIVKQDPLKITITKQKSDDTHSILKIYQPEENQLLDHVPKITIKPIKPSSMSPKITVKPIPSPNDSQMEIIHSPKVTIKPILRPELSPRQMKLKSMSFESTSGVTFEPISGTGNLLLDSENLSVKPITKTCEIVQSEDGTSSPLKLTIKPILKPEESSYQSPKITIKPIVKPDETDQQFVEESEKPERIILKIQKTNLPSPKERTSTHVKEMRKEPEIKIEAIPHDHIQKLDKIKLKLTKEGNHAQIIPTISLKRSLGMSDSTIEKRPRTEFPGTEILHTSDISINIVEPNMKPSPKAISEEVTIVKIDKSASGSKISGNEQHISQLKFQEMLLKIQQKSDITCTAHVQQEDSSSSDDVKIVEVINPMKDPLSLHDEDVMIVNEINPFQNVQIINVEPVVQTPKKRGRPRKNPLEVKPEIKGEDCVEVRPKRTCRAPPGRTPFTVKERKPRGAGRGRGSSRGRGASKSPQKTPKDIKTPRAKALKAAKALAKIEAAKLSQEVVIDEITIEDSTNDTPGATPDQSTTESPTKSEEKYSNTSLQMVEPAIKIAQIKEELLKQPNPPPAVYEDETRMSADNSRAQTPARQVFIVPLSEGPEESQSSVQSSATTESSKTKKGRLEVCDADSAVTVVDQIAEYSWGTGGGPYMLQEQIAQFLGVKSFKRKYPGLTRRPVDMQERDYIREKGLVSESMCDMGLTAVPSTEILDIMYTDFQEKYEEYRKFQRDKQSKEISSKQRAISLATTQEKSKIDFKERAVRSAANWNVNFNKARKESRRCCMDLQTFTINFPVGKTKVPQKNPVGHYPIALVPGQYTDYYKSYTSNELHYLPLNTVRYGPVLPNQRCEPSQSDGSQSESDSSSGSDSDSSDESMSTEEEVSSTIVCKPATVQLAQLIPTPKAKTH